MKYLRTYEKHETNLIGVEKLTLEEFDNLQCIFNKEFKMEDKAIYRHALIEE